MIVSLICGFLLLHTDTNSNIAKSLSTTSLNILCNDSRVVVAFCQSLHSSIRQQCGSSGCAGCCANKSLGQCPRSGLWGVWTSPTHEGTESPEDPWTFPDPLCERSLLPGTLGSVPARNYGNFKIIIISTLSPICRARGGNIKSELINMEQKYPIKWVTLMPTQSNEYHQIFSWELQTLLFNTVHI